MKDILLSLIRERNQMVLAAVQLLKDKFGDINFIAAKNAGQIPKRGFLDKAEIIAYNLHGRGCDVMFGDERIEFDFDFNKANRLGFNFWWLKAFISRREAFSELAGLSNEEFQELLLDLENENLIEFDELTNFYYLSENSNFQIKQKKAEVELAF